MSLNPNYKLMNCLTCGRDTISSSGMCNRCLRYGKQQMPSEGKDRKVIQFDGDPITFQIKENEDNYNEDFSEDFSEKD